MSSQILQVSQVTEADMHTFFISHFSEPAIAHFAKEYFRLPATSSSLVAEEDEDGEGYWDEEDDCSCHYYPDGQRRTLTDEQIAIFRHSELEAIKREDNIRKENERRMRKKAERTAAEEGGDGGKWGDEKSQRRKKGEKRPRGRSYNEFGEKIDLRKRTWDKMGAGLQTLDYGEEEGGEVGLINGNGAKDGSGQAEENGGGKRRKVKYGD